LSLLFFLNATNYPKVLSEYFFWSVIYPEYRKFTLIGIQIPSPEEKLFSVQSLHFRHEVTDIFLGVTPNQRDDNHPLTLVHVDLAQIVGEWDYKSFIRPPRTRFRDGVRIEGRNARSHNIHNANAGATPDFAWIED